MKGDAKMKNTVKHSFKVGDILYSSWGYEQTNIDFYQVAELNGSSMITLKPVALEVKEAQRDSLLAMSRSVSFKLPSEGGTVRERVDPLRGQSIRRKVSNLAAYGYPEDFVKISEYEYAYKYKGEKLDESWYA